MPTEIGREDVRRLVDQGAQLVEVLPAEEYNHEHLPGALNLTEEQIDAVCQGIRKILSK